MLIQHRDLLSFSVSKNRSLDENYHCSFGLTSAALDGFQQLRLQEDVGVDAPVLAAAVLGAAHVVQPPLLAPRRRQVQGLLEDGGEVFGGRIGRPLPAVVAIGGLVQRIPEEKGLNQRLVL